MLADQQPNTSQNKGNLDSVETQLYESISTMREACKVRPLTYNGPAFPRSSHLRKQYLKDIGEKNNNSVHSWLQAIKDIIGYSQQLRVNGTTYSEIECDVFSTGILCKIPILWELAATSPTNGSYARIHTRISADTYGTGKKVFAFYEPQRHEVMLLAMAPDGIVKFDALRRQYNSLRFERLMREYAGARLSLSSQEVQEFRDNFRINEKLAVNGLITDELRGSITLSSNSFTTTLSPIWWRVPGIQPFSAQNYSYGKPRATQFLSQIFEKSLLLERLSAAAEAE